MERMQRPGRVCRLALGSKAIVGDDYKVLPKVDVLVLQLAKMTLMIHKNQTCRATEHIGAAQDALQLKYP